MWKEKMTSLLVGVFYSCIACEEALHLGSQNDISRYLLIDKCKVMKPLQKTLIYLQVKNKVEHLFYFLHDALDHKSLCS